MLLTDNLKDLINRNMLHSCQPDSYWQAPEIFQLHWPDDDFETLTKSERQKENSSQVNHE